MLSYTVAYFSPAVLFYCYRLPLHTCAPIFPKPVIVTLLCCQRFSVTFTEQACFNQSHSYELMKDSIEADTQGMFVFYVINYKFRLPFISFSYTVFACSSPIHCILIFTEQKVHKTSGHIKQDFNHRLAISLTASRSLLYI